MHIVNTQTVGTEEELYWNTADGWTGSLQWASRYLLKDIGRVSLPMEGGWLLTPGELVQLIADNRSTNRWLSLYLHVYRPDLPSVEVGVKAFGLWVQRLSAGDKPYWSSAHHKTVKAFRHEVTEGLMWLLKEENKQKTS